MLNRAADREDEIAETVPGFVPRVVDGAKSGLDVEKFSATLAALESYVDALLWTVEPPPATPLPDDPELELRIALL